VRRVRPDHLIFGLALLALAALGGWWTLFLAGAVEVERQAAIAELQYATLETALTLGLRQRAPGPGDLPGGARVEMVACDAARPGAVAAAPLHGDLCLQPHSAAVAAIEDKLQRRRHMVHGEGAFLFLLLGVCTVMLWSLVRQERRQMERMESFLHAVTHEMKTPLTGIKSLLETLSAGRVPAAVRPRLLALGIENCDRLEHSIENVLIAGAFRSGRQQLRVRALPLGPALEAFVEHRHRTLPDRTSALRLAFSPGSEGAQVRADADMLRVVLENLVDNGFKYGGERPAVVLTVRVAGERAHVEVRDGGQGFEPAMAEQLFVPFLRGLPDGHGVRHGTGLGLSIARGLCRQMGGDLVAHSDGPGRGATFTVTLATAREEAST